MQRIARCLGLVFLLLALAGNPGQVSAAEGGQAGLVIQFDDGRIETRCVAFEGEQISGADLLALADLGTIVDTSSGMGLTICQIAGEGCAYPAEPCFCQCMGGGECAYWNYFYQEPGEGTWTYSALGAAMRKARPGSVEGWVWGDGDTPPNVEVTFEEICLPATATPAPTAPATDVPAPETPAMQEPADVATASPSATTPSPASTTAAPTKALSPTQPPTLPPTATAFQSASSPEGPASYWPFGLAVAGLALIGSVVWLRRR